MDFIINKIPRDLFFSKINNIGSDLEIGKFEPKPESLFSMPISFKEEIKEKRNIIDLFKYVENKPILNKTESTKYSLFERYQLYQIKIPIFTKYDEFMHYIAQSLDSDKTKEELFNDLLDTLGCEVFDFINELVEHRYSDIDFSSPFDDGKN